MQAAIRTATVVGVDAVPVEVQADVCSGLPAFAVVGLPDTAVSESRDRVRSAIRAAGFDFPNARVVINLAPAPLKKHGTGFDLPIALALLTATKQIPAVALDGYRAVGELGLDGSVRPVPGMLAHALGASRDGSALLGSAADQTVASIVTGLDYRGLTTLAQLKGGVPPSVTSSPPTPQATSVTWPDLSEIAGHDCAKRALEIAAAGGHNLLFVGPPGSGKTMLARALCGLLPPLADDERLESALVHSVAGLDPTPILEGSRPFRAPHHCCSVAGLVGGGTPPRPGEISLAHNGVLFLDELAEFSPSALQTLRQPLEDGSVTIVRAEGRVRYPARFALVAAMNPCPCGFLGDPSRPCRCSETAVHRYSNRVGGPLMDRLDLCVRVDRPDPRSLLAEEAGSGATSASLARILDARRNRQQSASGGVERSRARDGVTRAGAETLAELAQTLHLSARGVTRALRVAGTIADLDGSERVDTHHVLEAVAYRRWEST